MSCSIAQRASLRRAICNLPSLSGGLEGMVERSPETPLSFRSGWRLPKPVDIGLPSDPFDNPDWREEANLGAGAARLKWRRSVTSGRPKTEPSANAQDRPHRGKSGVAGFRVFAEGGGTITPKTWFRRVISTDSPSATQPRPVDVACSNSRMPVVFINVTHCGFTLHATIWIQRCLS